MITRSQLEALQDNQVVRYRIGRTYELRDQGKIDWNPWKTGSLYIQKTQRPSKRRGRNIPAGTICIICPRNEPESAEYRPEDLNDQFGIFDCEDYVFEIDGSSL